MKKVLGCVLGIVCCLLLGGCAGDKRVKSDEHKVVLFSWKFYDNEKEQQKLADDMEQIQSDVLYQSFPKDQPEKEIKEFLQILSENRKDVYYLTGDPKWSLDGYDMKIKEKVDRAASLNTTLDKGARIKGLVLDIEPYLSDEWEENRDEVMESYCKNLHSAYLYAQKQELEVIVCIPYYFDSLGYEDCLEEIISQSSDGIAVMNYNKSDECRQIETEVKFAAKYGKQLINVYEMQQSGIHGIAEENTYYKQGMPGVAKSFDKMRQSIDYSLLGCGIHDYSSLKEQLKNE